MAMNKVLSTMQMVMAKSTKGSITTKLTHFLKTTHWWQQFHFRKVLANLYQVGGKDLWASSNSRQRWAGRRIRESAMTEGEPGSVPKISLYLYLI